MNAMGGKVDAEAVETRELAETLVGREPSRSGFLPCPHCKTTPHRRTSRQITETYREIYYQCRNMACGHTWKASETYDYGIVPSGISDPKIDLPLRPMSRDDAMVLAAQVPLPDPDQLGLFDELNPASQGVPR